MYLAIYIAPFGNLKYGYPRDLNRCDFRLFDDVS